MSLYLSGLQPSISTLVSSEVERLNRKSRTFEEVLNIARAHGDSIRVLTFPVHQGHPSHSEILTKINPVQEFLVRWGGDTS